MASAQRCISLNALDHLPPPNYANAILYLRLNSNVSPKSAFEVLQEGLHRTFIQLPWLSGKVHPVSPTQPGSLEIRYDSVSSDGPRPYQLKYNELDDSISYEELRESAFHPTTFADESLTWAPFLPDVQNGTEVFVAQANFLPGVCLLTAALCHAAADGTGVNNVVKIWGDNCNDVQLGKALQAKMPAEIYDHDLLDRVWSQEGSPKSIQEIPEETWRLLGLEPPSQTVAHAAVNGSKTTDNSPSPCNGNPKQEMKACIFYVPPANISMLRDDCIKDAGGIDISMNDAICALIWRGLLRSRLAARRARTGNYPHPNGATNGDSDNPDDDTETRLDLPFDVRPYFPQSVPLNYLGNFTMINQVLLPVSSLIAPSTPIGSVVRTIRQVVDQVTSTRLMDAYSLARTLQGRERRLTLNNLRVHGNGLIITSLIAFPLGSMCFGETIFGNWGRPEALRSVMGAINKVFRYCAIMPRKNHGGVEFIANLFDDELDLLMEDEEFNKYAMFMA
jgi:hypothetical protein